MIKPKTLKIVSRFWKIFKMCFSPFQILANKLVKQTSLYNINICKIANYCNNCLMTLKKMSDFGKKLGTMYILVSTYVPYYLHNLRGGVYYE